jgi:DNA invertase Pin-like site-specific DNA recombinase
MLHIMERIARAGAGFRSVTENIETTTLAGRMMMHMVGTFAEFERAMIRERTSAGVAASLGYLCLTIVIHSDSCTEATPKADF